MTAKPTTLSTAPAVTAAGDPAQATAATGGAAPVPINAPQAARRPYEPPRILFREPLEAMAAICTPHPPAKANKVVCPMGPISS